ncbi:hypothetical protein [Mycolicibacter arupensis]|uniref:hypothetical protein n=1 Tax=Mycolicibacter arupensis TaxID=342002 RepID=UPI00165F92D0|nr:hypothetical protein [Mycolicibacter arupensis]MEB3063252.1 hypothetical protein [Mycolicibacter sp. MYC101]
MDDDIYTTANAQTAERIADAPLPTDATLRTRQNLPVQAWRFARLNLKMLRIIYRGHG